MISVALVALVGLGGFGVLGKGFGDAIGDDANGTPRYAAPADHAAPMVTSQQAAIIPIGAVDQFAARAARVSDPFELIRKAALSESPTLRGFTGTADEIRGSVGGYVEDLASRVNTETATASRPEEVAAARSQLLRTAFSGDADAFASAMDGLGKALGKRTKPPLSPELMRELEGLTRLLEPSGIRTFRTSPALSRYWNEFRASESGRKSIERILANRERLIDSVAKTLEPDQELERLRWVPMASNTESRAQLLEALDSDFTARSNAVRNRIRSGNPADARFDVVYVGAGPHSASAAYTVAHNNPAVSQLVVEAADVVGGNFRVGGDTFFLNSVTRMENSGVVRRPGGDVNLNPVAGPVGVPDFSGIKFPVASNMADVTAISLAASDADILLQTRVSKVTLAEATAPAKYKIEFASGDVVFTDRVVFGTGFGKSKVNLGDEATQRFLEAETAKAGGQIQTFDQWRDEFTKAEFPRDRYRAAQGAENVLVVGFGDSARVTIEALLGEGPEQLYRNDPAQAGAVGEITWLVGKDGPGTADEYLTGCNDYPGSRCRYSDITGAIRRLERTPEERVNEAVRLRQERVETMVRGVDGRIYVNGDMTKGYDRVITTTGYRSQLPEILNEIPSFESLEQLKRVELDVPGIGDVGENAAVAKKIADEEIYFVGPAAGTDLVSASERVGIGENGAALFALIPRTNALATQRLSTAGRPERAVATASDAAGVANVTSDVGKAIANFIAFIDSLDDADIGAPGAGVAVRATFSNFGPTRTRVDIGRPGGPNLVSPATTSLRRKPVGASSTTNNVLTRSRLEEVVPDLSAYFDSFGDARVELTIDALNPGQTRVIETVFRGKESSVSTFTPNGFLAKLDGEAADSAAAAAKNANVLPLSAVASLVDGVTQALLPAFEEGVTVAFSDPQRQQFEQLIVRLQQSAAGIDEIDAVLFRGRGNQFLARLNTADPESSFWEFSGTTERPSRNTRLNASERDGLARLQKFLRDQPSLRPRENEASTSFAVTFQRSPQGLYEVTSADVSARKGEARQSFGQFEIQRERSFERFTSTRPN